MKKNKHASHSFKENSDLLSSTTSTHYHPFDYSTKSKIKDALSRTIRFHDTKQLKPLKVNLNKTNYMEMGNKRTKERVSKKPLSQSVTIEAQT